MSCYLPVLQVRTRTCEQHSVLISSWLCLRNTKQMFKVHYGSRAVICVSAKTFREAFFQAQFYTLHVMR